MLKLTGMRAYTLIWFGQLISLTGSAMTRFAITIWAYTETGQASALALVGTFSFAPVVLLSPVAGALVDRFNRKHVMIATDLIAGLATMILLALYTAGELQVWHLYAAGMLSGIGDAFQFPAFSAAVTMLVDKKHYARAHAMLSMAQSASTIAAPVLAGGLLALTSLGGVLIVDVVTFLFAVGSLALIPIAQPETTIEGAAARGSLLRESAYGFVYIWKRKGLLGMQLVFFVANLGMGIAVILVPAMVLARTNNDEIVLGTVQSMFGVGGLAGGLLMTAWGGPKRRVHGVFLGMAAIGICGYMLMGLGRGLPVWIVGAFLVFFFVPIIDGSNQAIWQAKTAPDVQGRVFAVRRLIAQITVPVAMLLSGVLADHVFEPAMQPGGWLVPVFGDLVGTGAGAGMAVILIFTGALALIGGLAPYLIPAVREVELRLPDFAPAVAPAPTTTSAPDHDTPAISEAAS